MADCEYLPVSRFEDFVDHHNKVHDLEGKMREAAKAAEDYRVGRLNDLRSDLERDRDQFATKSSTEPRLWNLEERLRRVEQAQSGRFGASTAWIAATGLVFVAIQIVIKMWTE